ncbi:MAG TPA: nucleotidyl transferase AbiEii/AbiGii toxin family protein [Clostridia bacterium]|nr:nucleotidyl transferase AbiEii/AbiGii toxin family protein [Clostridia bacterium]
MDKAYVDTVRLLLEAAPEILTTQSFALKGGTALNLFVRDMPRLSVDIDVVYVNYRRSRAEALAEISVELGHARERLLARGMNSELVSSQRGEETKLLVSRGRSLVKIEVNHVFRGTLLPVEIKRLVETARRLFTMESSIPVLAVPELYGSKLVAALDRQHPRDFYDVRAMQVESGLTAEMIECFVAYLAGHNRPIHEVLFSRDHDMQLAFDNEFQGMTREPVSLTELVATRKRLREELTSKLTKAQRRFLLSVAEAEPEWNLIGFSHLSELPAVRWKMQNLDKLKKTNPRKFRQQADELRSRLDS